MYETILLATDGSDQAANAAETAVALAGTVDAHLVAVSVSDPDTTTADKSTGAGPAAATAVTDEATAAGVTAEAVTATSETTGSVAEALIAAAATHDADLIIVGTRGRSKISRVVNGSVAEQTLRAAPVPVLTVTAPRNTFETVVVPTDGSANAEAAADHAMTFAAAVDATVHAVYIADPTTAWGHSGDGGMIGTMERAGQEILETLCDQAPGECRPVETTVRTGSPARAIVDYSANHDVDVTVMGAGANSGITRRLLGSVAERTLQISSTPVLTVQTPTE
jgi:Universal stress protein UspA and related nucleotide-binding proteins